MSSKRLAFGGAVLAALAAVILILLVVGGDDGPEPVEIGASEQGALALAPCPPAYEVLRAGRFTPREVDVARAGDFQINGEQVSLQPPIDWTINPQQARAFSHTLFKFQWIDPLLYAYRTDGDVAALQQATDLVLDFARVNPPDGDPVDPDVWDDKRTGDRGPYLAYIMRAAECEDLLSVDQRRLLLELMARHIETLTNEETYKPTNHGLFVDLGLTLLSRQLDFLPQSQEWGDLGRTRFETTLRDRTVADEGLWLEHSAGYQMLITRTLARFLSIPGNSTAGLEDLRRRMQDVVGWLREPDGKIPQFGDSDLKTVPTYGARRARNDRGVLELDESGLAVVKRPGSYLSVLASYFSDAHKHADALTFDLFDGGRRLITDTGLYAKDKDENFAFAHSSRAHSVLTVDGEDFPRDGTGTYGSGILQTGKGNGYAAILGTNPATGDQGVEHQRLFLYGPGDFLVIADRLRADEKHRYARFLQFAAGVDAEPQGKGLRLSAPGFQGTVTTNGAGGERIELARGERDPLRGLTSPSFRRWVPRWTARLRSEGTDLDAVTTIGFGERPVRAELVEWAPDLIRIDIFPGGGEPQGLKIVEQEGDFAISKVPVSGTGTGSG